MRLKEKNPPEFYLHMTFIDLQSASASDLFLHFICFHHIKKILIYPKKVLPILTFFKEVHLEMVIVTAANVL